ncbi:MAG: TetR/AcrR family transcriptional regulator [Mucispirillum sp.]|nr:TetR/AcrR family transcriptional regulator [Mucispirillum sp.]
MNKRQQSALETKRKIIETAKHLLSEKGFDAINVDDITKAAGIAKGSFYTHFNRKEDVVLEIGKSAFGEIEEKISAMAQADILEKFEFYFCAFMEAVEKYGIHICREWIKDVLKPIDADNSKWNYDVQMLKNILITAVRNNELKKDTPIDLISHVIICELYGMMTCWCMSDGAFEPLEHVKDFSEVQLKSVLKQYINKD